ncbi:MAG: molybdate ABC transporter substrate-binding protein [Mycobacteriales bacterium]|nr:molybdate ABC transporter substrate-binding protein [Mycobacteriales bacterium]
MRTAVLALAGVLLTGCGGAADDREPLVVLAAASLTATFTELEAVYEREHSDVDVQVSFAGSQVLVSQVREGAPADVVVTADEPSLQSVAGLVGPPVVVARNRLALVTAPSNPKGLTTLADLARPGTTVVLAGPNVPVGKAARAALAAAEVVVRPVSEEPDVKAVVARVRLGEADAGIAYVTDLRTPEIAGTPLPGTSNAYPAAAVLGATHQEEGERFVAFLVSAPAQAVLAAAGFLPPP